jgi:hypothetical protein
MAKTRRRSSSDKSEGGDPLGKLIQQYHVSLARVLAVAVAVALVSPYPENSVARWRIGLE